MLLQLVYMIYSECFHFHDLSFIKIHNFLPHNLLINAPWSQENPAELPQLKGKIEM